MERNSLNTLSQCVDQMLLPGLSKQAEVVFTPTGKEIPGSLKPIQTRILQSVRQNGSLRTRQLDAAFPRVDWRSAARSMVQQGFLTTQSHLTRPSLHPKLVRRIQLAARVEDIAFTEPPLASRSEQRMEARKAMIAYLAENPEPIDLQWLRANLAAEFNQSDLNALVEAEIIRLWESEVIRDPVERIKPEIFEKHILTPTQSTIWAEIQSSLRQVGENQSIKPVFLFGVTGSGKTELYLRAVESCLQQGKKVIWLVPEIALTPQTIARVLHRFPGQVGLVHSRLTEGERYDTWRRARAGKLPIIVGPRSALFTPLDNLGLIIIDECHDPSYHQAEEMPSYNAVDVALAYCELTGSLCLMGTATPDVARFANAEREGWKILRLPERVTSTSPGGLQNIDPGRLPEIRVVDMRQELKQGNRSIFSNHLQKALIETYQKNQQSILYLNRRGSATHIFCRQCGYVLLCPRCSLPLTAHRNGSQYLCHACGYQRAKLPTCPKCNSDGFRPVGVGTETVEAEVAKLIPQARILRWDRDASMEIDLDEIVLTHFRNHHYDILVGTQMIAKGLDFPHVTLVGLVLADIGLNLPDYRSSERTYQLITQVAGRAGRGVDAGQVILQTYQPEQEVIQASASQKYEQFYQTELLQRRELGYPPYTRLVRFEVRDASNEKARQKSSEASTKLKEWFEDSGSSRIEIIGPAPCFYEKIRGFYRWQVILRGGDLLPILQKHRTELQAWRVEVDPLNLL
jgi:primosomal protein N' (replication factor Y)